MMCPSAGLAACLVGIPGSGQNKARPQWPGFAFGSEIQIIVTPESLNPGFYSNEWITTPERSLGSNHVVFGGMMLPVSAMSINCCIETG